MAISSGLFATNQVQLNTGSGTPNASSLLPWAGNSAHLRCAMYTILVSGGTINFDDTVAHSSYAGSGSPFASNEVTGTAYQAGGAEGQTPSPTNTYGTIGVGTCINTSGNLAFTINANVIWTASTISGAVGALFYDHSASPYYAYAFVSFGGTFATNVGTFTIQPNASGLWTWQTR